MSLFQNMVDIAAVTVLSKLLTPEFWAGLYARGQFEPGGAPNLLVVIVIRAIVIVFILVAARIVVGILRRLIFRTLTVVSSRNGQEQRRLSTLYGLVTSALAYTVYFIAIIFVLFTIGLTWKGLAPLLGAASILGLAVGFGAQRLVRDVITGLFILGEGQFDVGDWVTIGTVTGRVEDIGLRITRLRDEQGRVYAIANGDITQVFNASRGPVKLTIALTFQQSTSLEKTITAIRQAALDTLSEFALPTDNNSPEIRVVNMEATKVMLQLILWIRATDKEAVEDSVRRKMIDLHELSEVLLA